MEGSLGVNNDYTLSSVCNVLILVLMEDTLGDLIIIKKLKTMES